MQNIETRYVDNIIEAILWSVRVKQNAISSWAVFTYGMSYIASNTYEGLHESSNTLD